MSQDIALAHAQNAAAAQEKLNAILQAFPFFGVRQDGVGIMAMMVMTDGTGASFVAMLSESQNLRIAFTENLAQGRTEDAGEEGRIFVRINGMPYKLFHGEGVIHGVWKRTVEGHTIERLLEFIRVLLQQE